jgi:hypothetical protein
MHYRNSRAVSHLKNGEVLVGEWTGDPGSEFEKQMSCWTEESKKQMVIVLAAVLLMTWRKKRRLCN